MALVPRGSPYSGQTPFNVGARLPEPATVAEEEPQADFVEAGGIRIDLSGPVGVIGAAVRQNNTVGSWLADQTVQTADRYRVESGFSAWDAIKGTKYEEHWESFADVFNSAAVDAMKRQIDMELSDRRTLDAAGPWGTLAGFGAAVLDIPSLAPGGVIASSGRTGANVLRSALSVGAAAVAATAGAEVALQRSQQLRTGTESAFAIGGSAIFGALLGAGAGAILSRGARRAAEVRFDAEINTRAPDVQVENEAIVLREMGRERAGGVGAEIADAPDTLADLTVAGSAAERVAQASGWARLNPMVRLFTSPSAAVRRVAEGLLENPLYLRKNMAGRASEAGVETLVKEYGQGAVAQAMQEVDDLYKAMRRTANAAISRNEFRQMIGQAMRRGDESPIPEVAQAAKIWRQRVFEPLKERAIEAGLLPRDVDVSTAESYFSRLWNWRKIEAQKGRFQEIVRRHIGEQVQRQTERLTLARDARLKAVDAEIADLSLPAAERARLLTELPERLKTLLRDNAQFTTIDDTLSDLRSRAFAARQAGRMREAETLQADIRQRVTDAGKAYADFVTARNALQSRIRRIRNNVVGRQDQVERLRAQIAETEASNVERLYRLHQALTKLDGEMERAAPEVLEAQIADLRAQVGKVLERSNKAQDRYAAELEKLRQAEQQFDEAPAMRASTVPRDFYGMLDAARKRIRPDPQRRMMERPVYFMLRKRGGVDPDSPFAGELRAIGLTPRNSPGLFRRGGSTPDNIPLEEEAIFLPNVTSDDGAGNIRLDDFVRALRDELDGAPWRTEEQAAEVAAWERETDAVDYYREELAALGIDLDKMSNDEIMARLSEAQSRLDWDREIDQAPIMEEPAAGEGPMAPTPESERQAAINARRLARQEFYAAAERKRLDFVSEAAERIGEMEKIDPEEALTELRMLVERRLSQAAEVVENSGRRMAAMAERLAKADPEKVRGRIAALQKRRVEVEGRYAARFVSDADRADYIEEIVEEVYNRITGRIDGDLPRDIVPTARGPLKERTFNIPDRLVEDFIESDVELVGRRYARIMAAEVEMTNKFGSPDMKEAIRGIITDYSAEAQKVIDNPALTAAQREKALSRLAAREKADLRDIRAVRDMLRGTYMARENATGFARVLAVANTFNYLRSMGGVVLSSLADVARPIMVHGLGRYMNEGIGPLLTNLKAVKLSVKEARLAGAVAERILNTRMATFAEIADPYAMSSPFERFMENTAKHFSMLNGMVYWNDFMKSFASVLTQNRVLGNALAGDGMKATERAYMAFLGIDDTMARRIADMFTEFGTTDDGVRIANTEDWTDVAARRAYRAAVNKDVDSIIVTKGVGDTPLFARTPVGRAVLQFKSFALASHQRAFMRGLQGAQLGVDGGASGVLAGTIASVAIGMMVYWLKSLESNRLDDVSDNPGRWLSEGLDRSGLFAIAFEINNTVEKALGIGAYGALAAAFPSQDQSGKASRYVNRSVVAGFMGPTGDLVDTLVRVVRGVQDGDLTEGDVNAIRRIAPFATLPVIRSIVEWGIMPPIRSAVAD